MVATNYDWDPVFDFVAEEFPDTGSSSAVYTQVPSTYGNVLSQARSSTSRFFHFDAVGTTRSLSASDQSITDTVVFSGYGVPTSSTGVTDFRFRFVGQLGYYSNSLPDVLNARARDYEPLIVRWRSVDPLGIDQDTGRSVYNYAANNPVIRTDASGEVCGIWDWFFPKKLPPMPSPPAPPGRGNPAVPISWGNLCEAMCDLLDEDAAAIAACKLTCRAAVKAGIGSCAAAHNWCTKRPGKRAIEICLTWHLKVCAGVI